MLSLWLGGLCGAFGFVAFAPCIKQGLSRTSGDEGFFDLVDCVELFALLLLRVVSSNVC